MSGYSSKKEATQVLKGTIAAGVGDLPRGYGNYYISRIFDEVFTPLSGGGWAFAKPGEAELMESMEKHLRQNARETLHRERNAKAAESLPWGDTKCRLLYGYGLETYMSM